MNSSICNTTGPVHWLSSFPPPAQQGEGGGTDGHQDGAGRFRYGVDEIEVLVAVGKGERKNASVRVGEVRRVDAEKARIEADDVVAGAGNRPCVVLPGVKVGGVSGHVGQGEGVELDDIGFGKRGRDGQRVIYGKQIPARRLVTGRAKGVVEFPLERAAALPFPSPGRNHAGAMAGSEGAARTNGQPPGYLAISTKFNLVVTISG